MSSELIYVQSISVSYRRGLWNRNHLLSDCSFHIQEGESVGLTGPSGCGKSTLGRVVAGLEQPDSGEIFYRGSPVFSASRKQKLILRQKIQILFQDPGGSFNPVRSLRNSLERVQKLYPGVTRRDIRHVLEEVGLHDEMLDRYPHQISGGQAQRLALGRILLTGPELIILDEPTSGLDISVQAQILHLLRRVQKDEGVTYLFISHDPRVVRFMTNRELQFCGCDLVSEVPQKE